MTDPFDQLGAAILGVSNAFRAHAVDSASPYKPNSGAWKDRNAEHHFTGAWSQMPMRNVNVEALRYLANAEDHLRSCGYLIPAEGIALSPISLCRTVLNATAMAHWLLEPGISATERMRRYMNVQLHVLRERVQYAEESQDAQSRKVLETRISDLNNAASAAGMTPKTAKSGRQYIDTVTPSDTQLLREFTTHTGLELPAEFLQRIHSAAVHANPNSFVVSELVQLEPSRDGVGMAALEISNARLAQFMLSPAYMFVRGTVAAMEYFGQSPKAFKSAALPHVEQISAHANAA
ncbi:hypothetical protein [Rhodococcus qingshengii]|uniref:hypothetical protein n=1 Tax=Rhodococcus qingshengii TaxID=334542 RepID=UPI0036DD3379